jgi:hypothetical protein
MICFDGIMRISSERLIKVIPVMDNVKEHFEEAREFDRIIVTLPDSILAC